MPEYADPPRRDWSLYGLVVAIGGILALLIFAEGRTSSAQQETELEKLRTDLQVTRVEQQAEIDALRTEFRAEFRTLREERRAEAEETRRYIAEAIAEANERAAVNSIRIDHLERSAKPPPDSPPAN